MSMRFCLHHGLTEHYKNGKCRMCVAIDREFKRRKTLEEKKALDKSLHLKEKEERQYNV